MLPVGAAAPDTASTLSYLIVTLIRLTDAVVTAKEVKILFRSVSTSLTARKADYCVPILVKIRPIKLPRSSLSVWNANRLVIHSNVVS